MVDKLDVLSATHVVMGRIGASYGIKGWVKLFSFTDPIDNLLEYKSFFTAGSNPEQGLQVIEIDEIRAQGKGFVGHIVGCDIREDTRNYTGNELLQPKTALPLLQEGYYWHQLEGLKVFNQSGDELGSVHHMLATGANDVLVVQASATSIDKETRLIPYITGQVVVKVDIAAGLLQVAWEKDY
ncbi:MAG: ribosome maturation factor RimM [Pseudohongiellaceae bacterium]